ncbi:predicted protein [Histoplasma capsulatum H143]|uniref:Uncharacterized protein n=1 Tax=Ajellomyces capsulatus (strain H143) TaxID=544712 RepID=C6H964_AJECH|nr:predicted protein [Histoplasma capsulatum H143]
MTAVIVQEIIHEAARGRGQPGDVTALDPAHAATETLMVVGIESGSGRSLSRALVDDLGLAAHLILIATYLLLATVVGHRPGDGQGRQIEIEIETGRRRIDLNSKRLIDTCLGVLALLLL